jgi:hypothetical protein
MKLILNEEKFGWSYTLCCKVAVTIEATRPLPVEVLRAVGQSAGRRQKPFGERVIV